MTKIELPIAPVRAKRLKNLLHRLLDIYSPSGKEEEVLEYLHGYLKRHGLPVTHQAVDDSRFNLLVLPPDTEPKLLLVGHVDTVVAYDFDDLACREEGDLVYGVGAADMKGGCAAMIEAFLALHEHGVVRPPVGLALVVGEEEEGDGTQRLVKELHVPWALIGEPTGMQTCLSHYGYVEVHLTTRGKRVHASLANQRQTPVEAMLQLLLKISHYATVERPEMVYNVRDLASSRAGFAVPERCDAWLDLHLPPSAPIGLITLELEDILLREREENPSLGGELRFVTIHGGYELPEKGQVVEVLRGVFRNRGLPWQPRAFRSHSDANILWAAGVKPILLGCGELEQAHTPEESVSFAQVQLAAELYFDFLHALTGG
jgi:acetylornithine deacetylase